MSEIDKKYTIEYFRVAGQKVDEQERGVRVTCKETGAWADCTEHKSRYKNIDQAIEGVELNIANEQNNTDDYES